MKTSHDDLVTSNEYADIEIDGNWTSADTTAVNISGITTDFTHYIHIYTTTTSRHRGIWNTNKYRLISSEDSSGVLRINTLYITIDGVQVQNTSENPGVASCAISIEGNIITDHYGRTIITKSILRGGAYPLLNASGSVRFIFGRNLICYGGSTGAVQNTTLYGVIWLEYSTLIGNTYGFRNTNGQSHLLNCYTYGTTAYSSGTGLLSLSACASSDTTGSSGLQNIAYSTDNFINVTGNSEDLHLTPSSALKGVGALLTKNVVSFYYDISAVLGSTSWGSILELTNGSSEIIFKARDFINHDYYNSLEKTITLKYSYVGTSTKLAVISDLHMGDATAIAYFTNCIDDMDDYVTGITKVFVLGDISAYGTEETYDDYIDTRATSDIAVENWHELAGNHDAEYEYFKAKLGIDPAYYSITVGNIVFILLGDEYVDGVFGTISSDAITFLSDTISNNQDKNVIILTHQPRQYTMVGSNVGLKPYAGIDAALVSYDFAAWLSGHIHAQEGNIDPGDHNYNLGETFMEDIDGETRGTTPDIGVDEFFSSSSSLSSSSSSRSSSSSSSRSSSSSSVSSSLSSSKSSSSSSISSSSSSSKSSSSSSSKSSSSSSSSSKSSSSSSSKSSSSSSSKSSSSSSSSKSSSSSISSSSSSSVSSVVPIQTLKSATEQIRLVSVTEQIRLLDSNKTCI